MQREMAGTPSSVIGTLLEMRNTISMAARGRPTPEQQQRIAEIDEQLREWREKEIEEGK